MLKTRILRVSSVSVLLTRWWSPRHEPFEGPEFLVVKDEIDLFGEFLSISAMMASMVLIASSEMRDVAPSA